jgi:hypothetical protein
MAKLLWLALLSAITVIPITWPSPMTASMCLTPLAEHEPLCNAEMADSPWGTSHRVSYAQASSPFAGPIAEAGVVAEHVVLPGPPIALDFSSEYSDGGRAIWGSPLGLQGATAKIDHDTFQVIDVYIPAEREMNPPPVVAGISGAYNVLDRDDHFIVGRTSAIEVFADSVPGDRFSPIALVNRYFLPPQAFCRNGEDVVAGMVLMYDGNVAFVTEQAVLGIIPRDPAQMTDANLHTISLNGAGCADDMIASADLESVSNSLAADEEGGIYMVTSEAMYKFRYDGSALTQVWRAEYAAEEDVGGVRLGEGSGSTPTLMGTELDDDQFVVITDAQKLMHLVLLWRDEVPAGWQPIAPGKDPRIACEFPITFGDPEATQTLSEQSVLVRGHAAVVVNNQLQDNSLFADQIPLLRQIFSALEGGNPDQAPFGLERVDWDPVLRTCRRAWVNTEVSIPNGIPTMSTATGLVYGIGQRKGTWGLQGVDFASGESRLFVPSSEQPCSQASIDSITPILLPLIQDTLDRLPNSCENSTYAGTEVGPDGAIYTGTFVGATKFKPPTVAPIPVRRQAIAGVKQADDLASRALADLAIEPDRALEAIERGPVQLDATLDAIGAAVPDQLGAVAGATAASHATAARSRFAAAQSAFGDDTAVSAELVSALAELEAALTVLQPCAHGPQTDCRTAQKSSLLLREKRGEKDQLLWRWVGGENTTQADFGDPTTSADTALCIYAGTSATLVADANLPADGTLWTRLGTRAFKFKDKTSSRDGLRGVLLKGSDRVGSKVIASGRGDALPDPTLPLSLPVLVQLLNTETGACFEASYDDAAIAKNDGRWFKARLKQQALPSSSALRGSRRRASTSYRRR